MADDKKKSTTLTDEDLVTSPQISRRTLIAGAGVALGGAAIAGRSALAGDKSGDKGGDKGEGDKAGDKGGDKGEGDKAGDKGGDKSGDKGEGDKAGDKGGDKSKIEEGRDSD